MVKVKHQEMNISQCNSLWSDGNMTECVRVCAVTKPLYPLITWSRRAEPDGGQLVTKMNKLSLDINMQTHTEIIFRCWSINKVYGHYAHYFVRNTWNWLGLTFVLATHRLTDIGCKFCEFLQHMILSFVNPSRLHVISQWAFQEQLPATLTSSYNSAETTWPVGVSWSYLKLFHCAKVSFCQDAAL